MVGTYLIFVEKRCTVSVVQFRGLCLTTTAQDGSHLACQNLSLIHALVIITLISRHQSLITKLTQGLPLQSHGFCFCYFSTGQGERAPPRIFGPLQVRHFNHFPIKNPPSFNILNQILLLLKTINPKILEM